MADLVGGLYAQRSAVVSAFGLVNGTQSNIPARTNAEYGFLGNASDGALAATGVATAVAVPCDPGTVISNIAILVGGTAASTPTHGGAGIYSGIATPALLASSADTLTTAIAASAPFQYALSASYTVKPADVPNGFLYVSVFGAGTAVQTAMSVATPTAINYGAFTSSTTPKGSSPLFWSMTHGSSLTTAMPATIASPASKAVAPIVFIY